MNSKSLVAALLESEGYAAFEYLGDKVFQGIGISPAFCKEMLSGAETAENPIRLTDSMPFLENFLVDAEVFWNSGAEGRVESGRWIEETKGGGPIALEASAFRLAGKRILLIRNPQQRHEDEVQVFQRARESHSRISVSLTPMCCRGTPRRLVQPIRIFLRCGKTPTPTFLFSSRLRPSTPS